ncbi:hypothetical protein BD410DRAFT_845315 [Rickenella mellea]|uniref:Uncharacterized protein n=1 Tax=Rickenella mellea TaxID=50990 RepID=A0A4Y7PJN4_9AGAM|nr:hypothetical protein BD410DRAFT_845315 [Rickenella mellea]
MDTDVDMRARSPSIPPPSHDGRTYKETPVKFPFGRGKNVPDLLCVEGHPQWPHGMVAVVVYNFSVMKREDLAKPTGAAPYGVSEKRLHEQGWYRLDFGQATFARQKGGEPKDDVFLEAMFDPRDINHISNGAVDRFFAAMTKVLGEQSERSSSVPVRDAQDVKRGGTFFERGLDRHLNPTHQGPRCYSTLTSSQYIRSNLVAPSSNMKGPPDPDIELRKELNEAGGQIACVALVGCRENRGFFTAGQLNIAHAVPHGSTNGMQKDLGIAGLPHKDSGDAPGCCTVMTCHNDLPPVPGAPVVFNGRRYHVASPPQLPPDMPLVDWAYRCTFILYPSLPSMDRSGPIALCHGPDTKIFETDCSAAPGPSSILAGNSTFARDGLNIMAEEDRDTFLLRELWVSDHRAVRGTRIVVDQIKWFNSFGTIGPDGEVIPMKPWPLGPGGSQEAQREALLMELTLMDRRQTPYIFSMDADGPAHGERRVKKKKTKKDKDGKDVEEEERDDRESDVETAAPAPRRSKRLIAGAGVPNNNEPSGSGMIAGNNSPAVSEHDMNSGLDGSGEDALMSLFETHTPAQSTAETPVIPIPFSRLTGSLRHPLLSSEFKDLYNQLLNQSALQPCADLVLPTLPFDSFEKSFGTNPVSRSACQLAIHLSTHIPQGVASSARSIVNTSLYRAQIMFVHWRLWMWFSLCFVPALDEEVTRSFNFIVSPPVSSWLGRLVKVMREHVENHNRSRLLPAAKVFGDEIDAPDFPLRSHTAMIVGSAQMEPVTEFCEEAVIFWLGFGGKHSQSIWRLQGQVLGAVFAAFMDSGVLLSSAVWKAYASPLSSALAPNSNNLSTEDRVDNLYEALCFLRLNDSSISPGISQFSHVIRQRLPELYTSFHAATNFPFPQAPLLLQKSAEKVVTFLRELYPVLCKHPRFYSDLCRLVSGDLDKLYPFRELAPSRSTILQSECFSPDTIYTRDGFFNAVMFRAITFAAPFLTEHNATHFSSADDFLGQVDDVRSQSTTYLEDKYFCDPRAYGPATQRYIENVPFLWEKSQCWETFIHPYAMSGTLVPFNDMQRWLLRKDFKGVGQLTAYLLTCDLVYANVVCTPSPAEVGHFIMLTGGGPYKALNSLGVIGTNVTPGAQFAAEDGPQVQAFVELHQAVGEILLEWEKELIGGYDVMILEHILCKMTRTVKHHKFYKYKQCIFPCPDCSLHACFF